jgi:hypothetical protein
MGMQCVIRDGEDFVFATHDDSQDVAALYPGAAIVKTPPGFQFAYDDNQRQLDPRRFAAEGATPLG